MRACVCTCICNYIHVHVLRVLLENLVADALAVAIGACAEILKMREGMWEAVAARKHTVVQAFPARFAEGDGVRDGEEEVQVMLYGHVVYRLKGKESDEELVDWAGHARLVRAKGEAGWKFAHYRVWLQR